MRSTLISASTSKPSRNGKKLQLAITVGADQFKYTHEGEFGVTGLELLKPLETTARHIGMTFSKLFAIHGTLSITDEQLDEEAQRYVQLLSK